MRQTSPVQPFLERILGAPATLPGRWSRIRHGAPVAVPSARRAAGAPAAACASAVRAMVLLAEDAAEARFVAGADPAFVATLRNAAAVEHVVFRTRDGAVLTSTIKPQSPAAAIVFAAALLAAGDPALVSAHAALLDGLAAGLPQADLDAIAATAGDELLAAIAEGIALDTLSWFSQADPAAGDLDEALDTNALPLGRLFADPVVLARHLAGQAPEYAALAAGGRAVTVEAAPDAVGPTAFIGDQLDKAVRYMAEGKHVLHHGPTGTGKSFVWEQAMRRLDPSFDPDAYPYQVNGSAGLEDIDLVGQVVKDRDGATRWVDGPLTRAMRDGRRIKIEELNRMPTGMTAILMAATDYGRYKIPALDELVVAAPGFAVDATMNLGAEYTGTEAVDPAVMRRFARKVRYDFLPADLEVRLLRSRVPALRREDAETLVRIAGAVRDAYEHGSGDVDVDLYVSPAALIESAALVAAGLTVAEAVEDTWLADVAWTKPKAESVRALVDLHVRDSRAERRRKAA